MCNYSFAVFLNLNIGYAFFLFCRVKIPKGSSTELSHKGSEFFKRLFWKYDKDRDGALSPLELSQLFSTCPNVAWGADIKNIVPTNHKVRVIQLEKLFHDNYVCILF